MALLYRLDAFRQEKRNMLDQDEDRSHETSRYGTDSGLQAPGQEPFGATRETSAPASAADATGGLLDAGADAAAEMVVVKALAATRAAAIRALSRREYSVFELRSKLERNHADELVEQVLDELLDQDLLSDRRFAEVFVRSRIGRGQGPMRIRQELRQRGINDELIDHELTFDTDHWHTLAAQVLERRQDLCRAAQSDDAELRFKAKGRIGRFLASRGFPSDVIHGLMREF